MIRRVLAILLAGTLAACAGTQGGGATVADKGSKSINEVLAAHSDSLMALPGVVGTAVALCDGERCIKVLLADSSAAKGRIPKQLEGYRVVVEGTGAIRPR